jgi:hypothetical protein
MKRRSFLSLLGLAPAAPLIAREMVKAPLPAPQPEAPQPIVMSPNGWEEARPLTCWSLQPLDEYKQPWMGLGPAEAECNHIGGGESDLTVILPQRLEWIGKPMPSYVRTYFFDSPVLTMPSNASGEVPIGTVTIIQRVRLHE